MENYENTLSEITTSLVKEGYEANIQVVDEKHIKINDKSFTKDDIKINKVYRFEGMSNPADNSICYAIECNSGEKGILINAYGADASDKIGEFVKDVKIEEE